MSFKIIPLLDTAVAARGLSVCAPWAARRPGDESAANSRTLVSGRDFSCRKLVLAVRGVAELRTSFNAVEDSSTLNGFGQNTSTERVGSESELASSR